LKIGRTIRKPKNDWKFERTENDSKIEERLEIGKTIVKSDNGR